MKECKMKGSVRHLEVKSVSSLDALTEQGQHFLQLANAHGPHKSQAGWKSKYRTYNIKYTY